MSRFLGCVAVFGLLVSGCDNATLDSALQRMMKQPKYRSYQASEFFADGRAMRPPPPGTIAREHYSPDVAYRTGRVSRAAGAGFVLENPVKATPEVLARGRERFDITCGTCHGIVGDGVSMVARNMALAPAPTFHSDKLRYMPDGYFFEVITNGYGLMPSHSWQLSVQDRWSVIHYLRALQLSQNAPIAAAPADVRSQLEKETQ